MSKVEDEIRKALESYHKEILFSVGSRVYNAAMSLRDDAVVNREAAFGKHDFTGNLLNSIVVAVYKDGEPDRAYFASGMVKGSIQAKMTAPKTYHFKVDYEEDESDYQADVETNRGRGEEDARRFFEEYRPQFKDAYTIVFAYTTEYASFVENLRHTTGFYVTYSNAKRLKNVLRLPRTYGRTTYSVMEEAPF